MRPDHEGMETWGFFRTDYSRSDLTSAAPMTRGWKSRDRCPQQCWNNLDERPDNEGMEIYKLAPKLHL